jgi:hypothetical protein
MQLLFEWRGNGRVSQAMKRLWLILLLAGCAARQPSVPPEAQNWITDLTRPDVYAELMSLRPSAASTGEQVWIRVRATCDHEKKRLLLEFWPVNSVASLVSNDVSVQRGEAGFRLDGKALAIVPMVQAYTGEKGSLGLIDANAFGIMRAMSQGRLLTMVWMEKNTGVQSAWFDVSHSAPPLGAVVSACGGDLPANKLPPQPDPTKEEFSARAERSGSSMGKTRSARA